MKALEVHFFEFATQWVVEVIEDGLSISNNAELLNDSCEKIGFNFDLANDRDKGVWSTHHNSHDSTFRTPVSWLIRSLYNSEMLVE